MLSFEFSLWRPSIKFSLYKLEIAPFFLISFFPKSRILFRSLESPAPKEEGGQGLIHLSSRGAAFRLNYNEFDTPGLEL